MAVRSALLHRVAQLDVTRCRETYHVADQLGRSREIAARLQRDALAASRHALDWQAFAATGRCVSEVMVLLHDHASAGGQGSPSRALPVGTMPDPERFLNALDEAAATIEGFLREAGDGESHARVRRGLGALETSLLEGISEVSPAARGLEIIA